MVTRRTKRLPRRTIAKQKRLPPNTLENIVPPNEDYDYFKDRRRHPFRYESNNLEMVNAWWLAEAALLAYAQPEFAAPCFQKAGLQCKFFDGDSSQCYVANNDDFVMVTFRGTEVRQREGTSGYDLRYVVADWLVDSETCLLDAGQGRFVHEGFFEALDEIWDRLKPYLDEVSNKDGQKRPIWFTGHSLGAALATLAVDRYKDVAGLYTFGSPRVGDRAFAKDFGIANHRFVNNDDVITKVPFFGTYQDGNSSRTLPFGWYHHIGDTKYIDQEDIIHTNPPVWIRLLWNFRKVLKNAINWGLLVLRLRRELPDNALTDHAPIYYPIRIWNNYVREHQETQQSNSASR